MSALRDLYQDVILDHARKPRNFRRLDGEGVKHAEGRNPLCGDQVSVELRVEDGVIKDAAFHGAGCAISTASASVMTELARGKTEHELDEIFQTFHLLVTRGDSPGDEALGKLAVFGGVASYPARVKCAILAWHAMRAALGGEANEVTTE